MAKSTGVAGDACEWVASEFAAALGRKPTVDFSPATSPPPSAVDHRPESSGPPPEVPVVAHAEARQPTPPTGRIIAGCSDLSQIGRGASGVVYRAHEEGLDRWVAVKVLLVEDPEDPTHKRFLRESQITAKLSRHPNIITVYRADFTADGSPYVATDRRSLWPDGGNVRKRR